MLFTVVRVLVICSALPAQFCASDKVEPWRPRWPHLSAFIGQQEGITVDGIPRRLNNPGALAYAGQAGASRDVTGYARFKNLAQGWIALDNDLEAKIRHCVALGRGWAYLSQEVTKCPGSTTSPPAN